MGQRDIVTMKNVLRTICNEKNECSKIRAQRLGGGKVIRNRYDDLTFRRFRSDAFTICYFHFACSFDVLF